MEKKTHIACANLASLYIIRPTSIIGLLTTVGVATLGGLLPDVDLKDSTSDKLFDRLMASLITIIVMGVFVKYFFNINIYTKIREYNNIFNYIVSICLFIILSYMGSKTSHRSFTHSILGLFIYTMVLSYSFSSKIYITYFISHLSHIIIDLLNMKGICLFYPLKFRFSLKLCESDGSINKLLFVLSSIFNIVVLIMIGVSV